MCGITGIYSFNMIGQMHMVNMLSANNKLEHRGPDAARLFDDGMIGLGHRRLSIIDLSPDAHQPMTDESGRYTIAFNGEIYNYVALREELKAKGHSFSSSSDTEVLLQLYMAYGEDCLDKLNGFFAFAIYDNAEETLFLARDRMGIKPLVYYQDHDKFIFSSEIGSLLEYNIPRELDWTSLYQYLQFNYIPAPATIFQGVSKLPPGHCMTIKGRRDITTRTYWSVPEPTEVFASLPSYGDAQKQLIELLDSAVQDRLVSDVPLGAFLSGGIDSSLIVALASRHVKGLKTFSIGYQNEPLFDETKYANLVADKYKTDHTVFKLGTHDFYAHMFDMLDHFGEPFADSSALPVYILSKRTREQVTVSLSGDGADELFAGYNKYFGEYQIRQGGWRTGLAKGLLPLLDRMPKSRNSSIGNKIRQMHRLGNAARLSPQERYWFLCSLTPEVGIPGLLTDHAMGQVNQELYRNRKSNITSHLTGRGINDMLHADTRMLLPNDMLHKVDQMSMAHSLEVRVPFLDHRLVEFAFGLPASYKINGQMKKRVVQDAARGLLPAELYNRPKHGFDVPLAKGYKTELRGWIEGLLDRDFVESQGIFRSDYTEGLKKAVFSSDNFDQNQVWGILAFQHWWKKVMNNAG